MTGTSILRDLLSWMGWCPMNDSAHRDPKHDKGSNTPGNIDPISRRAAFFSFLTWGMVGLSYLVALIFLPSLPETIPVHWNLFGEADGFSSRFSGVFGLPVIITLTALLLWVLPRFEKMKQSLDKARDLYQIVIFSIISILLALEIVVLIFASGMKLPVAIIVPMLLGVLFIIIGSLLPYIGRNTTIGIRLPWTLRDDEVWKKTHERGGPAFVVAGALVILLSPIAGILAILLMLVILLVVILYVTIYSYRLAQSRSAEISDLS